MSDKDDGGPAFPVSMDRYGDRNEGMALRDYFAAQVLVGFGTWTPGVDSLATYSSLECRAKLAYEQADAMLEVRKR